jgi:hypothetical protein
VNGRTRVHHGQQLLDLNFQCWAESLSRQIEYVEVFESAVKPLYVISLQFLSFFWSVEAHAHERISDVSFLEVSGFTASGVRNSWLWPSVSGAIVSGYKNKESSAIFFERLEAGIISYW